MVGCKFHRPYAVYFIGCGSGYGRCANALYTRHVVHQDVEDLQDQDTPEQDYMAPNLSLSHLLE